MPKKKITIDNLAGKIDKLDQKFDSKIDKLDQKFDIRNDRLEKNLDALAVITKRGFERVDIRFDSLEKDHENMMLKLSNVAYRFELVALSKRVEFLEKKHGISHR